MSSSQSTFAILAAQAGRGDANARQQLEHDLAFVVRRVLQHRRVASDLDRRILAEANRYPDAQQDRDLLIRRVAASICLSVIAAQTRASRSTAETVAGYSNNRLCPIA